MSMGSHQSARMGTSTWLTPPEIIEALGSFDLDPCTPTVMPWETAARRYTEEDDGLAQPWEGRVWLNPPYSREAERWLAKMVDHDGGPLSYSPARRPLRSSGTCGVPPALMERRLHFHHADGTRAEANAGAPSVLAAYGLDDVDRLAESKIDGAFVPLSCVGQMVVVMRHDHGHTWCDLIREIASRQGGTITLDVVYALVRGHPKTEGNQNWRAKVRQSMVRAGLVRVGPSQYSVA